MSWLDDYKGKTIIANGVQMPDRQNLSVNVPATDDAASGTTVLDFSAANVYGSATELRDVSGVVGAVANTRDGGAWLYVEGGSPGDYVDNVGTVIVPTGGDGSEAWVRQFENLANLRWFGATGDGVSDDTTAVHAAFDWCYLNGRGLFVPAGEYRVTATWTTLQVYRELRIVGETSTHEDHGSEVGNISRFVLDNLSSSVGFLSIEHRCRLCIEHMAFSCSQYAMDRKFIHLDDPGMAKILISDLHFEDVEHPFAFSGGYGVQSAEFRNIVFRNSGGFASDGPVLKGTDVVISNIAHEGNVPNATVKTIFDLRGFRGLAVTNMICEGALPSDGQWICVDVGTDAASYIREEVGTFDALYCEWNGDQPLHAFRLGGGKCRVIYNGSASGSPTFRVANQGMLRLTCSTGTDTVLEFASAEDESCVIEYMQATTREPQELFRLPEASGANAKTIVRSCVPQRSAGAGEEIFGDTVFSNAGHDFAYRFDGGYPSGALTITAGSGSSYTPSTDATYGRKISATPPASPVGASIIICDLDLRGAVPEGSQMGLFIRGKAPTLNAGTILFDVRQDGANNQGALINAASEEEFAILAPIAVFSGTTASVGFRAVPVGVTSTSGDLEIYNFAFLIGHDMPKNLAQDFRTNIETWHTAAPTAGTWNQGDRVMNSNAAVGQPQGWVCTTAGTPGTWTALPNL